MERQWMYSYELLTAGNKGIPIGLLRTAFFYTWNNKNIQKYVVNSTSWQFTILKPGAHKLNYFNNRYN